MFSLYIKHNLVFIISFFVFIFSAFLKTFSILQMGAMRIINKYSNWLCPKIYDYNKTAFYYKRNHLI